jgi:uncharacterized protein (DUF342 family)
MKGLTVTFDSSHNFVDIKLSPAEMDSEYVARDINNYLIENGYDEVYLSYKAIKSAVDKANHFFKTNDSTIIEERVGERRNAEVEFKISDDAMFATLLLTAPYGGKTPDTKAIVIMAARQGIVRGVGKRHITNLLKTLKDAMPGEIVEGVIAKGLPPKDGHSSHFVPLVPNALERILRPQIQKEAKIDMRNLGEIVCVKTNTPVLRRDPPSLGRVGFTIRNDVLEAKAGHWLPFKMGSGTAVSDNNENILISTISGMPKYLNQTMNIDDTFICKGVNVGTGHIKYSGAVLVNGDVTENMQISATGDVTINGFVESATIEAGGDIIITEGAMGKVNENSNKYSCQLKAAGNIHVQHGQGLDIYCSGNVTIGRQLAYSRLNCGGTVTVGKIDDPQGNLFACEIVTGGAVVAGTIGAVSGSTLKIDFSPSFNQLMGRKDAIDELLKQLRENTIRHKQKIDLIRTKLIPRELNDKVDEAEALLKNETALLSWIENKAQELKDLKQSYQDDIRLIANKRLYSGVSLKLNNRNWRSEREYGSSIVRYEGHQWLYDPI